MRNLILAFALITGLAGCTTPPAPPWHLAARAGDTTLYEQLGEMDGITRIVEGLLINISEDERIVHHFAETDIDRLNEKLIEQICVESGGPCTYTGDSMQDSHAGFDISEADFNALVEGLIAAMDAEAIPVPAQNRLLARLAPMRGDIIYR
ncbi:group 1 truncated hemoglobin [Halopseudomonas nanhaiensis]|uniref:group I truncated hemoglobin n=1 Tax=Halopseudomonas nanhaiensis TaxID=2830842 RepID=UPI001CBD266B|nr:group 1 truncated hemoglobin [Halopseudomonas nanhaiensis]UAW99373.1 group 1 truncated hemoglobin [Halopseudomonas nanhaiensis]